MFIHTISEALLKILNKILCLLIVSLLFLHTNYVLFYYSLYEINVTSLTVSCCEKIIVNCNAHCYLDKKIDGKDSESNGTAVEIKLKISEYIVKEYSRFYLQKKNQNISRVI